MTTAREIVDALGLTPNQTCGYTRGTYSAPMHLPAGTLPEPYAAERPLGSGLYFLVAPEAPVRLHRIANDQLYHYYAGDPLDLVLMLPDGTTQQHVVGPDVLGGQVPQLLIPGGTFHTARVRGAWFLGGSSEWPGVVPSDVELGDPDDLAARFPDVADQIRSYPVPSR